MPQEIEEPGEALPGDVQALPELAVGRGTAGLWSLLSLLPPEVGEARGGAEFPGLCLLLPRNLDGFEKTHFGFALRVRSQEAGISRYCCSLLFARSGERQFPLEPIQLGLIVTLPILFHCHQRFGEGCQPFRGRPLKVLKSRLSAAQLSGS